MPLLAAMGAALTGFLVPWRLGLEFAGRPFWLSAGDIAMAAGLLGVLLARPRAVAREFHGIVRSPGGMASILLVALAAWHAVWTPATAGGGSIPALATAWAIVAGHYLARLERIALLDGLAVGALASALLGFAFLPFRPDLVTEHLYFSAFAGTKNTFAFLAAAAALHLAGKLAAARRPGAAAHSLGLVALASLLLAANARAAAVALGAALLVLPAAGQSLRAARGLVAIGAAMLAAGAAIPWDRIHFAWAILVHADSIPFLGFGPGFGYGLDTFLKLTLELGPAGALAAVVIIVDALRRRGLDPWVALVLVTALAHDAARWPLFWMVMVSDCGNADLQRQELVHRCSPMPDKHAGSRVFTDPHFRSLTP